MLPPALDDDESLDVEGTVHRLTDDADREGPAKCQAPRRRVRTEIELSDGRFDRQAQLVADVHGAIDDARRRTRRDARFAGHHFQSDRTARAGATLAPNPVRDGLR